MKWLVISTTQRWHASHKKNDYHPTSYPQEKKQDEQDRKRHDAQDGQDILIFYPAGVADPAYPVHLHHVNLVKCTS